MIVRHHSGSYEVKFRSLDETVQDLPSECVFVTDSNVDHHYRARLPREANVIVVPPGESSKSTSRWSEIQSRLAQANVSRKATVIALGGGVIGDLAGFVAATYMRGIDFIQIPTSLLAQVDSSVGGKVGIDLPEGKNLVGAFYPPVEVNICLETLATLPEREYRNGMAEVWKYGFILDCDFARRLEDREGRDPMAMVQRCIDLKREVVEADEYETKGERAKLNFGHTTGHAIEKLTGYGPVLHGEAISVGMVVEAALGEAIGLSEAGTCKVVEECLRSEGLPTTSLVLANVDMLIETMRLDKKTSAGRLAFSLLTRVGECRLVADVAEKDVRAVLADR